MIDLVCHSGTSSCKSLVSQVPAHVFKYSVSLVPADLSVLLILCSLMITFLAHKVLVSNLLDRQ